MLSKPAPRRPALEKLIKDSIESMKRMSHEELRIMRREQAISFVYGNLAIDNDRITREMVEKAYDSS
jgi:hypothetical protein